jgi:hypothetical protein
MHHGKSLRVIGQSLEAARVAQFQIENSGDTYLVLSNSLTHRLVRLTPVKISQLEALGQKQRRTHSSAQTQISNKLSQLLRSLGNHLDRARANAFQIFWGSDPISIDYQQADGQSESQSFTIAELKELGLHNRAHRSARSSGRPVLLGH